VLANGSDEPIACLDAPRARVLAGLLPNLADVADGIEELVAKR
jgi:hypothetical protein